MQMYLDLLRCNLKNPFPASISGQNANESHGDADLYISDTRENLVERD